MLSVIRIITITNKNLHFYETLFVIFQTEESTNVSSFTDPTQQTLGLSLEVDVTPADVTDDATNDEIVPSEEQTDATQLNTSLM